jgi:hypothetical protein
MKLYKYGMRLRGFSPGCQPLDGLRKAEDGDERYYDYIFYDRPLTEQELKDYSLDLIGVVDNG